MVCVSAVISKKKKIPSVLGTTPPLRPVEDHKDHVFLSINPEVSLQASARLDVALNEDAKRSRLDFKNGRHSSHTLSNCGFAISALLAVEVQNSSP